MIDPAGEIRLLDGHHRGFNFAILDEQLKAANPGDGINIKVHVLEDFRGASWQIYADRLINSMHKGQFDSETLRRAQNDPVALIKSLPDSFAKLKDSPFRSWAGTGLFKHGVGNIKLVDYAEVIVGRKINETFGVHSNKLAGHEISEPAIKLFGDLPSAQQAAKCCAE